MKFKVKVLRIAYGEVEIEVESEDEAAASVAAVEKAKNGVIPTQRSDYEVVGVYPVKEVECSECGEMVESNDETVLCKRCERMMG